MAITYNISRCRKGYGIYLKALSQSDLLELAYKMPEITLVSHLEPRQPFPKGAIQVISDRLYRHKTLASAEKHLAKLSKLPKEVQIEKLKRVGFIKPIPKDYVLAKLKYFQVHRDMRNGKGEVFQGTSQNKNKAYQIAEQYSNLGVNVRIKPTVGRYRKFTVDDFKKIAEHSEVMRVGELKEHNRKPDIATIDKVWKK